MASETIRWRRLLQPVYKRIEWQYYDEHNHQSDNNFSGSGPIGGNLSGLEGNSLLFFEGEPVVAKALYDCCFDAYQAGLARLGSLITIALFPGTILPVLTQGYAEIPMFQGTAQAQFGRGEEETFKGWEELTDFCMDCGDEARQMLDALG